MLWKDLEYGFQVAFEGGWEAYCGGSIPIGAVVLNQKGEVVSIGRNRIYELEAPRPQIFGHQLAHAEANAILQLSEDEYPDIRQYTLFSTMEPCPFCFGAIAMGSIKHVKYAARDNWAGATSLVTENKYLSNKRIKVEGPFDILETLQIAWQTCFELEKYESSNVIKCWEQCCLDGVQAGRKLYQSQALKNFASRNAKVEEVFDFTIDILTKKIK
jgi:tRNA(adenine34) deaminase